MKSLVLNPVFGMVRFVLGLRVERIYLNRRPCFRCAWRMRRRSPTTSGWHTWPESSFLRENGHPLPAERSLVFAEHIVGALERTGTVTEIAGCLSEALTLQANQSGREPADSGRIL